MIVKKLIIEEHDTTVTVIWRDNETLTLCVSGRTIDVWPSEAILIEKAIRGFFQIER